MKDKVKKFLNYSDPDCHSLVIEDSSGKNYLLENGEHYLELQFPFHLKQITECITPVLPLPENPKLDFLD